MAFHVELEQFAGPLQLLLSMIEEKKLPITDFALASVTEPYVRYIESHDVPTYELADFLLIASRLMLMKSAELLPAGQEDTEEAPNRLAAQVRLYQICWEAAKGLDRAWKDAQPMYLPAKDHLPVVRTHTMPKNVTMEAISSAFERLLKYLQPFFSLKRVSMERVSSVAERMEELRKALLQRARLSFSDLVKGASSRVDVVVQFLALLELLKERQVRLKQQGTFSDIVIERAS